MTVSEPYKSVGTAQFKWMCFAAKVTLVLALVLYKVLVFGVDFKHTYYLDLNPQPDAIEYYAQAQNLIKYGFPCIQIGDDLLPSIYPPGYPLLIAGYLQLDHLFGGGSYDILAPFRVNQYLGLSLLVGTFIFIYRLRRPLLAGACVLLLVTQPSFVVFAASSLSEIPGATMILLALACIYTSFRKASYQPFYLAAFILGYALEIRVQLILFAPLLGAVVWVKPGWNLKEKILPILICLLLYILAVIPFLVVNEIMMGNPLATGYAFWIPRYTQPGFAFNFSYVVPQLSNLGKELVLQRNNYLAMDCFLTVSYFLPSFMALAALGLFGLRWSKFSMVAVGAWFLFFLFNLFYFCVDTRFYLILVYLLIVPAGWAVEWAILSISKGKSFLLSGWCLLLFLFSFVGFPSCFGYPHTFAWSFLSTAYQHVAVQEQQSPNYLAAELANKLTEPDSLIFAEQSPVFMNSILKGQRRAVPLDGNNSYRQSYIWKYDQKRARQLALEALAKNQPVYGLLHEYDSAQALAVKKRFPEVPGCHWETMFEEKGTALFKLK